jgi:hypothetical protein
LICVSSEPLWEYNIIRWREDAWGCWEFDEWAVVGVAVYTNWKVGQYINWKLGHQNSKSGFEIIFVYISLYI